jgi:ketosteroid isomerase-like protein
MYTFPLKQSQSPVSACDTIWMRIRGKAIRHRIAIAAPIEAGEDGMRSKTGFSMTLGVAMVLLLALQSSPAQLLTPGALGPAASAETTNPLADTSIKPGKALLMDLEAQFAKATADGGGKAFATWFAEDGVSLGNGQAPVHGRDAIARQATWLPKDYQLQWTPTDAVMSPAGDMGYTWGHYEGHSRDADGNGKVTNGRYLTIWQKQGDGSWKVVLDSSSDEPAGAADCCKLPPGQ